MRSFISELKKALMGWGIGKGGSLLISSDFRDIYMAMMKENKEAGCRTQTPEEIMDIVIQTFQKLVGDEGTLMFPTYDWGFCHGEIWDRNGTKGKTGVLSNFALKCEGFNRTRHPLYSFAVWGKDREFLCSMENKDAFGADSPFAYLYQTGGKNISLGAENYFTYTHFVEECVGVDYRYIKNFTSEYMDGNIRENRTYSMYVRQLDPEVFGINVTCAKTGFLMSEGAMERTYISDVLVEAVDCRKAFGVIRREIVDNQSKRIVYFKG